MWNNPNKMLLATNVLSSAATLIPNPIAPRRHRQLHANAHDGPRVARVKHHQKQHAPYRRPSRLRGRPDDDDMTFVSSQGCTAVSIDTRTALARFLARFWSHTHVQVGVPAGFCETHTRTRRNLYPCVRVRVFWGTGAGSPGKPQGYPCQSLSVCDSQSQVTGKLSVHVAHLESTRCYPQLVPKCHSNSWKIIMQQLSSTPG